MRLLALIKQVPDTFARLALTSDAQGIETKDLGWVISPYDEFAIEAALRLREAHTGEVIVASLGPARVVDSLRQALAMGADAAFHFTDAAFEGADAAATALVFSKWLAGQQFDLILCGRQAVDDDCQLVHAAVAERLGWPHVHVVRQLEVDPATKTMTAHRDVEGGVEVVRCPLPAVITCQWNMNQPRLPSLQGIMKAKSKPITPVSAADAGVTADDVAGACDLRYGDFAYPAQKRQNKIIAGEPAAVVKELVRLLREEAKVL